MHQSFANNQDLKTAMSPAEISERLSIHELKQCRYQIMPCTALTQPNKPIDSRIKKGVKWINDAIKSNLQEIQKRVTKESKEYDEKEKAERKKKLEEIRKRKEEEAAAALQAQEAQQEQMQLNAKVVVTKVPSSDDIGNSGQQQQ